MYLAGSRWYTVTEKFHPIKKIEKSETLCK